MRLLLITSRAPFGPQERFVIREAEALSHFGVETTLAPVLPGGDDTRVETPLDAVRIGARSATALAALFRLLATRPRALASLLKLALLDRRPLIMVKNLAAIPVSAAVAELAVKRGAEHLHGAWASIPATVAMFAARLTGLSWSFSAHRWDIDEANLAQTKLESATFARAISERGQREFAAAAGHRADCRRISVVHLGVKTSADGPEPARPARGDHSFIIATVGNLVEKKGHRYLLDAVGTLRDDGLPVQVVVGGDGPERHALERQAEQLGLHSLVHFAGRLSGQEIDHLLRDKADVILLASIVTRGGEYEGIPVSLIEGMAAGLPAVATTTGSMPELITEECGILVAPADSEALAGAIRTLAESPELASRMGSAAQRRVRSDFDEDAGAAALAKLLALREPGTCSCRTANPGADGA